MTPSLEGSATKAKETPSPHEVRLALLDSNPVFKCLKEVKKGLHETFWGTTKCEKKASGNFLSSDLEVKG